MDNITIETCDYGHRFAALNDHPKSVTGIRFVCPHCCVVGILQTKTENNTLMNDVIRANADVRKAEEKLTEIKKHVTVLANSFSSAATDMTNGFINNLKLINQLLGENVENKIPSSVTTSESEKEIMLKQVASLQKLVTAPSTSLHELKKQSATMLFKYLSPKVIKNGRGFINNKEPYSSYDTDIGRFKPSELKEIKLAFFTKETSGNLQFLVCTAKYIFIFNDLEILTPESITIMDLVSAELPEATISTYKLVTCEDVDTDLRRWAVISELEEVLLSRS